MLALLLVGAVLYLVLGDTMEALILGTFALFSVVVTLVQEVRTERVLETLREMDVPEDPDQATMAFYGKAYSEVEKDARARGADIFDFARVWRNRERGPLHHPEFTLLEWYRAGAPYETLMADCANLMALAAESAGARLLTAGAR